MPLYFSRDAIGGTRPRALHAEAYARYRIYYNDIGFEYFNAQNKSGVHCLQAAKSIFILPIFALAAVSPAFILHRFRTKIVVFSMSPGNISMDRTTNV
jgi:hypothetical protein